MAFKVVFIAHTPDAEARGDGPSSRITKEVMKREGWFS